MTGQSFSRALARVVTRGGLRATSATRPAPRQAVVTTSSKAMRPQTWTAATFRARFLSTTSRQLKGILPDSDDPSPPNVQPTNVKAAPAELTDADYHELADEYLETVLARVEEIAEKDDQVDVEFAAGVLNVTFPNIGTYVINKQPPNKQIWLSSPLSGPKRYDYVVYGEGQAQKEDTAVGDWVYLRDGSTMNDLFKKELEIALDLPPPQ